MFVKRSEDVPAEPVAAGSGTTRQVLIGEDTGPNFQMRRFIMEPGGGMPRHTNTVEHEQYVLRGRARIGIGDETVEVMAGDVVFIPAGIPHWYSALEGEPFEFLCLVPNRPDRIELVPEGD
jgi:quercetin dioxygenase-like cupin family protein